MRFLLLLILSLFTLTAFGQNLPDSGFTNKAEAKNQMVNGKKEGKWCEYWDSSFNSTIDTNSPYYRLLFYENGKITGIARSYYKEGTLRSRVTYMNGERYGEGIIYDKNGKLSSKVLYNNGKVNGVEKDYYPSGALKSERHFINDSLNGITKDYYENGKLKEETPYNKKKRDGIKSDFYESGSIESVWPYMNDSLNGLQKNYYQNGIRKSEMTYYKNMANGLFKTYDTNGKMDQEAVYDNDTIRFIINDSVDIATTLTEAIYMQNIYCSGGYADTALFNIDERYYKKVLKVDSLNPRANYGLGSLYYNEAVNLIASTPVDSIMKNNSFEKKLEIKTKKFVALSKPYLDRYAKYKGNGNEIKK